MKNAIKVFLKKLQKGEALAEKEISLLYKFIDKSAKVGIISKQSAARKKSKLSKKANNPSVSMAKVEKKTEKKAESKTTIKEKKIAKKTAKK